MATKTKVSDKSLSKSRSPPGTTPEARYNQLVALALDTAEDQLRNGTASSQVITQLLKYGTEQARLEREIMIEQKKLVRAKTESLESTKHIDKLYADAISAMRKYSGGSNDDSE